jgi:hypothetical protein
MEVQVDFHVSLPGFEGFWGWRFEWDFLDLEDWMGFLDPTLGWDVK